SVHSQLLCSFMPVDYFLIELYSMPKSKFDFLAISKFRATDSGCIQMLPSRNVPDYLAKTMIKAGFFIASPYLL
ncbi:MAG: hypothetical protein AB7S77_09305, partial [Desulfatirhabdiaceae bacterium]